MSQLTRIAVSVTMAVAAVLAGMWVWQHYLHSPWTRDARIRADVIVIAPDVSGWVTHLNVKDNQRVEKGDVLFEIDSQRYRAETVERKAHMEHALHAWQLAQAQYKRRIPLGRIKAISAEDLDNARIQALLAKSEYELAKAQWETSRIDLARTQVTAPASGTITNVRLQEGNYVTQGGPAFSLIKAGSFYVTAYFEETKLALIREGQKASIALMSGGPALLGHVESIAQGVANSNTQSDPTLLPQVQQAFTWVRLAQRIPVDIRLDRIPPGTRLSAGMSASVNLQQSL
ncbi:efflux RND transporter periplasmic adaptor subunit [Stutzerimonas nitrititolerans]|uniref:efflux RND transporter periplasmic adaptor subunit n=1 Tax=Stutzerimonas nitrititolerans TaxID=2482751 RepID=UPI0028A71FEB|nr:efflux RND transporter periplasmic adaptor subunit [Stutzerimonas nitrititolerans]